MPWQVGPRQRNIVTCVQALYKYQANLKFQKYLPTTPNYIYAAQIVCRFKLLDDPDAPQIWDRFNLGGKTFKSKVGRFLYVMHLHDVNPFEYPEEIMRAFFLGKVASVSVYENWVDGKLFLSPRDNGWYPVVWSPQFRERFEAERKRVPNPWEHHVARRWEPPCDHQEEDVVWVGHGFVKRAPLEESPYD